MKSTEDISFAVTPELKQELAEAAKSENISLSDYLHDAAKCYMKHRNYQRAHEGEGVGKSQEESGFTDGDAKEEVE